MVEITSEQKVAPPTYDQYGTQISPGGYGVAVSSETGLSPGQTSGTVGGQYVERPKESDISKPYVIPKQPVPEQQNFSRMSRLTPEEAIRLGRQPVGEPAYGSQLYYKNKMLKSESAQWASEQEFRQKARVVGQATPGTNEYRGTIVTPQLQSKVRPGLNIAPQSRILKPETKYDPKYGLMIREDIFKQEQEWRERGLIKGAIPEGLEPSWFSKKSIEYSQQAAKGIRGMNIRTGQPNIDFITGLGKESIARATEFGGMVIPTSELIGKTAFKEPAKLPEMALIGSTMFVGGTAKQAQENPAQLVSDIVVTAGVFKGIGKIKSVSADAIKFTGKTYIPPEQIIEPQVMSGAEQFPLASRGTTGAQLVREFKTSQYRLPISEGKIGGWHATPSEFAKTTVTQAGTSEGVGLYIAPSTSPYFWKIEKQYKLFGFDNPPESPTGIWIELKDITRSPPNTRMNIEAQNRFLMSSAPKGKAFISAAFEAGIKPEKEAIIPPETPLERVSNQYYTKWKGKKVPLMEYKVTIPEKPQRIQLPIETETTEIIFPSTGRREIPLKVTAKEISWNARPVMRGAAAVTVGRLSRKQSESYERYTMYKEPVFTPGSLVVSLSRSQLRSSTTSSQFRSSMKSLIGSSRVSSSMKKVESGISRSISSRSPAHPSRARQSYYQKPAYIGRYAGGSKGYAKTVYFPSFPSTPPPPTVTRFRLRNPPKTTLRKPKIQKLSFGKFPEIARVASPRQVMRGVRI